MADRKDLPGGDDLDGVRNLGRRVYNPYQDLSIPHRALHDLPTSPEFLLQEESLPKRRSWGENLTYCTGAGYLCGVVSGAGLGLRRAVRAAEPGDTLKIRVNGVLNSSGQDGRRIGNRFGAIGLLYAGMESGMGGIRSKDDWVNSVAAGLGAGALFKASSGPRSATVAGVIGGLMVGAAITGKQVLERNVLI